MPETRPRLIAAFMAWQALTAGATAFALLVFPPRFTAGPAMTTVYRMAPRSTWGVAFAALAACCVAACIQPLIWRPVLVLLIAAHTAWALGLTLPLFFASHTNLLTPLAWGSVAGSAMVIAHHTERHP